MADDEARARWNRIAAGWERQNDHVSQFGAPVARRMVELLDPQPGETILDVAAGVGDTGFLAAPSLAPGGRLISSDFADGMVEAARRRAADLGLTNVEHLVADAADLPLADASVDGVLCRWGLMLMPAPDAAVREWRRVLGSRGRLAFAVWGERARNRWATLAGPVLERRGLVPPADASAPGMFGLADRGRLRTLVEGAGFGSLELEEVAVLESHHAFDAYWAVTEDMSGTLAAALAGLDADEREVVRAEVERAAAPYLGPQGLQLPGVSVVGIARL